MPSLASSPDYRRLLGASVLAGVLCVVAGLAVAWGRLLSSGTYPVGVPEIAFAVAYGGALATVLLVPFLLAVLVVVGAPSLRTAAGGAVLVYAVDLALTAGQFTSTGVPTGVGLPLLAVPLPRVATVLAVATGVWLAHHGGYGRLAAAAGDAAQHPLLALVADRRIGPDLSLQRGLVAASVAGVVAAASLVVARGVRDLLRDVARPAPSDTTRVVIGTDPSANVGIPPSQFPVEWLVASSFLLAVLFVTGSSLRARDLLKGVGVVLGVQVPVRLSTAGDSTGDTAGLTASADPALAPLGDVILLVGIAVAVWLAYHGGLETLAHRTRSSWPTDAQR